MSNLEDLEQRVAVVEAELALVRQEAAAARALAVGADRDVAEYRAELRGHTHMLNALRETQVQHYTEHKADSAELRAGIIELRAGVTELKVGITQIVGMLDRLVEPDNGQT